MTPCSLYCPNSHSSTSSISRSPPAEPNTNARPGRDGPVPRPIQRTRTRSLSGRLFRGRSRRPARNLQPSGTSSAASRNPFRTRGKAGEQPVELITGQSRGITSWRRPAPSELLRTLIPHSTPHDTPRGRATTISHSRNPPDTPRTTFQTSRRSFSGARGRPRGTAPTPPHRRLPGHFDPAPADLVHMHPAAPTDTGADPAPRPPSGVPPTGRRPRGRRPFRRPGKDR